jgi:hypothetical protein
MIELPGKPPTGIATGGPRFGDRCEFGELPLWLTTGPAQYLRECVAH